MHMQRQRRNGWDNYWNQQLDRGLFMESPPPSKLLSNDSSPSLMRPSYATSSGAAAAGGSTVGDGGLGYIQHTVTKYDTLAGVAIKYGVEVADIKKMNGLTTDLQMFARKTLHIPLPGRHPPSPIMSNGHDIPGPRRSTMTPPSGSRRNSEILNSIKSLKLSSSSPQNTSPSMDALRDYYGLKPTDQTPKLSPFGVEYGPASQPPLGLHRKCKSLANGMSEKGDVAITIGTEPDSDTWYDILMSRRRSEVDLQNHTPEMMLKPDTTTTSAFSAAAGKGLALRPKAAGRTTSDAAGGEGGLQNLPPVKLGDSLVVDVFSGVKKSSSSPSFNDTYNNNNSSSNFTSTSSSIWPTSMLTLTADIQASTAAITRPIFDGLPKPMSGRKNKAAID